jgi:hypothetical protein
LAGKPVSIPPAGYPIALKTSLLGVYCCCTHPMFESAQIGQSGPQIKDAWWTMRQTRITNEWILDRFDDIYPAYRVAFARLMVTLRRDFDGDLDAMLVLLTLSLGTERTDWGKALLGKLEAAVPTRLTNTQSIALATGIPRESVRRKLEAMQAKGWVTRDDDRNWAPTRAAADDLRASSVETIGFMRILVGAALNAAPKASEESPTSRT